MTTAREAVFSMVRVVAVRDEPAEPQSHQSVAIVTGSESRIRRRRGAGAVPTEPRAHPWCGPVEVMQVVPLRIRSARHPIHSRMANERSRLRVATNESVV